SKDRYVRWYEQWLAPQYESLSGYDMYGLRSGINHQAKAGPRNMKYERVVFIFPHVPAHPATDRHAVVSEYGGKLFLTLDPGFFCDDIIGAVQQWYHKHQNDANVLKHIPNLMTFRPNGLPPHFDGMPVIA